MATMAHTDTISEYNVAQTRGDAVAPGSSHSAIPSLAHEQYNQLIILLNKHTSSQDRMGSDNVGVASFMIGKRFCFFTSMDNNIWIIKRGASDHITPDLSLLHDVKAI